MQNHQLNKNLDIKLKSVSNIKEVKTADIVLGVISLMDKDNWDIIDFLFKVILIISSIKLVFTWLS